MGSSINKTSKRHIRRQKDVIWRINRENRSTAVTCARDEVTKKRKKPDVQSKSGYSSRPPTSWDRNEILHGVWHPVVSSKVRISSASVKWFRSCGGRNLPLPLTWPLAYTTACTTVQAVMFASWVDKSPWRCNNVDYMLHNLTWYTV